jgi:hypothetical protein
MNIRSLKKHIQENSRSVPVRYIMENIADVILLVYIRRYGTSVRVRTGISLSASNSKHIAEYIYVIC